MLTYDIDLDVTPGGIPRTVHVKQYQTDAWLNFHLYTSKGELNINTANITDVSIRGTKSDGNGYSANASYTAATNTVGLRLSSQMTAKAGKQSFELTITDNSGKMITATFYLDVQRAAFDMDTPSNSQIREIVYALDHAEELIESANTIINGIQAVLISETRYKFVLPS